jgi:hypothetical protein
MAFTVTNNIPGFLPDSDPVSVDSWADAVAILTDDMQRVRDELAQRADELAEELDAKGARWVSDWVANPELVALHGAIEDYDDSLKALRDAHLNYDVLHDGFEDTLPDDPTAISDLGRVWSIVPS